MFRLIAIAAAAAAAFFVLFRKRRHPGPGLLGPHATVVIGGTKDNPRITKSPQDMAAFNDEEVVWSVTNKSGGKQKIAFVNFKHKDVPGAGQPVLKNDADRFANVKDGETETVRDKVKKKNAVLVGHYKYDIHLNGSLAEDPDILIKERI